MTRPNAMRLDLTIERNASFSTVITWRNEAAALVDLTGYTADMDIRATRADTAAQIATFTAANGRITLGGAAGTITLTMTAADTDLLVAGVGWYDLLLTSPGGVTTRLVHGVVNIDTAITT